MPTNEERKAVAARLRESINLHGFAEIFGFSWNDESDWYWRDVAAKVADYVEPEPERTCKCESYFNGYNLTHVCTGCGYLSEHQRNYCPSCGAKVVSE